MGLDIVNDLLFTDIHVYGIRLRPVYILVILLTTISFCPLMICSCFKGSIVTFIKRITKRFTYGFKEGMAQVDEMGDVKSKELCEMNPPGTLSFYGRTRFAPECCSDDIYDGTLYASSPQGCACLNPSQIDFLASRGGNMTMKH
jgi:hypothetical protein